MARWEYCRIVWTMRDVSQAERQMMPDYDQLNAESRDIGALARATFGTLRFLGSGRDRQQITHVDDEIARLGREGWELVSHTMIDGPTSTDTYYFKRPIAD